MGVEEAAVRLLRCCRRFAGKSAIPSAAVTKWPPRWCNDAKRRAIAKLQEVVPMVVVVAPRFRNRCRLDRPVLRLIDGVSLNSIE